MNNNSDIASIKAEIKVSFSKEIAELDSTLQRIKEENKEVKERNTALHNALDMLKQKLTESEDNIAVKDLQVVIDGYTESTKKIGSVGQINTVRNNDLKIFEQLDVLDNKNKYTLNLLQNV